MTYELARDLKDAGNKYVSAKQCSGCSEWFIGGHKAIRCQPCQLAHRMQLNKGWQRAYYEANKEAKLRQQVARQRERRQNDPEYREKMLTKGHNRRAYLAGCEGSHTTEEWPSLCAANDNECASCHEKRPLTRDHIIPLSRGGTNDINNIQPLCGSCNSSKGAKII